MWLAPDWSAANIERVIFANSELVTSAGSVSELAAKVGLPADNLAATIHQYNELVQRGDDLDFHRFGASSKPYEKEIIPLAAATPPRVIAQPPFYALQMFPMTRKSNGGLKVDLSGRVLNAEENPLLDFTPLARRPVQPA